ncbi:DUF305 domain-containing protein [Salmonella enterica]|nr:DUF305 domain-containing protein [Salmonella enterica]EDC7605722.1 DUF305 domain-containing protein [Salmonella enterica subsp. enterica serovar Newport]ECX3817972.1 DUF305 domain-containing protein [Salmonella enterica]ECY2497502.1 DUF305 domain-containing protein [Salmonella enterica]ECY2524422.1 DUF305 domain-containing protein [Salmonella enterica]
MSEHITPSSAASQEYLAGMQKMRDGMMKGSIGMAKTQLKYGKDPELRKLAEDIIRAQQPETDQMQTWLKEQKKH